MAKCPDVNAGEASSSCATQDDLLHASERLEDVLEQRQGEEWAVQLLATFSPRVDVGDHSLAIRFGSIRAHHRWLQLRKVDGKLTQLQAPVLLDHP